MLVPIAGDWLALLGGNSSAPVNYTVGLNGVGGNASVPYNLQVMSSNQNATVLGYSGMVAGGNSTTVPVTLAANGTLAEQVCLAPALSVNETGNIFDFVASGLLNNGSSVPVDEAYLIINGSQYEMTRNNDSTFEFITSLNPYGLVHYSVYMLSSTVPGGFATGFLHDEVAVGNVTQTKAVVGRGYTIFVNATVMNQGDFDDILNVTFSAGANVIYQPQVNLTSKTSATIAFSWNTTGFAYGNYTISVYAQPVSGEINTTNNVCRSGWIVVTIPGDTNGDFKVSLLDLVLLANAYGFRPSDAKWNALADIDGNGVVGLSDLVIMAKNYGQQYP